MQEAARLARFKEAVLAHLDAAYNLARWLTRDDFGAEEAVQEACVRAYRAFGDARDESPKAWFMTIVRHCAFDWLRGNKTRAIEDAYEEDSHGGVGGSASSASPETMALQNDEARWVRRQIATLPAEYREVIVLRELEDMSYKEISAIVAVPIGTVMSRLARGRDLLQQRITASRLRKWS